MLISTLFNQNIYRINIDILIIDSTFKTLLL